MTNIDHHHAKNLVFSHLQKHLDGTLPHHPIREVYQYAVFPPGKLFRPLLAHYLHRDVMDPSFPNPLESDSTPHSYFGSFLELHHAYTLVHDDLPCMDDDDMRRNRPTVHIHHGEWKALLVGDGLINASYHLLSKIQSPQLGNLLKLATWSLGPKGLIHGQVLDLSQEMSQSFPLLIQTHILKTSRLIQLAFNGSFLLIRPEELKREISSRPLFRTHLDLLKLGHHLGMSFQLLDDLLELTAPTLSDHERSVNPFLKFPQEAMGQFIKSGARLRELLTRYNLKNVEDFTLRFLKDSHGAIRQNREVIEGHLPLVDLNPIVAFLESIQNFD